MATTKACAVVALALAATIASGCSVGAGGDKAGGPADAPVVLRMASEPSGLSDAPPVADFVRRVHALSGGSIQIKVINQWGHWVPGAEAQAVRAVAAGRVDLGWATSRMFDTMGVRAFQALSAPMLIDSYPLEAAVLKTTIPAGMLAGLSRVHVTGLAVLGDGLRHPIAVRRPMLGPSGWRSLSFGTNISVLQEQAIRALGATPVVATGPYRAHDLATGQIQGFEFDVRRFLHDVLAPHAYLTVNVALWPQFDVLFANPARLASLTPEQRAWLRQAAREAAAQSVSVVAGQEDPSIGKECALGARFALATPADLAALHSAFTPVYRILEANPKTGMFIRRIQALKRRVPPPALPVIPSGCTVRQ